MNSSFHFQMCNVVTSFIYTKECTAHNSTLILQILSGNIQLLANCAVHRKANCGVGVLFASYQRMNVAVATSNQIINECFPVPERR